MNDAGELSNKVRQTARKLGFPLVGITPAARPDTLDFFKRWLNSGFHGEMGYMQRREAAYEHPSNVLQNVKTIIIVAATYGSDSSGEENNFRVAKYATSQNDYHDVLREKLKPLASTIHDTSPGAKTRVVVDTAPLLERDFARLAGLGWFGKNTLLINKHIGSFFFLAALLTNAELEPDPPHSNSHCGTCTRCLEACPTNAFTDAYSLDARKCISYLTIELRDKPIPVDLRSGMGDWIFGCDVCQDVCPWNRKQSETDLSEFRDQGRTPQDAAHFLEIDDEQFQTEFGATPFSRPGRVGMARNAAIVLGNSRDSESQDVLIAGLGDASPIVREACVWALAKIRTKKAMEALRSQESLETDEMVRSAITHFMSGSHD
ncbi:Epoxyqueuosine reductase [Thalassoglobus neptunius]|uniref:Epoxyqueuosine reductase n=1 Tax=Thalassoglobus neptunius TaxID=1938619 RepID=A0A5C5X3D1_9PLAN|nr:tRNA epoxyqueuosine(34) reductase QueG [Thalassoglobus neptunius]TWT57308.1 Epoxyqueuosine reductase [Thalassoglobus neptunius]